MVLNRTVSFLGKDPEFDLVLTIDKAVVSANKRLPRKLFRKVESSISLDDFGETVPATEACNLVLQQYEACLTYIYSNPIWEKIRRGDGREILLAYIIESLHYLAAAPSRMSSGLAFDWRVSPMSFILSEHLIEEADHAVFFENSLATLGIDQAIIRALRPSPVTYEWIYLMRGLSSRSPLTSAVCSGLMETTAKDKAVVKGWHKMLIDNQLLDKQTVEKFYQHVELDIKLGHGACWEEVIMSNSFIPNDSLRDALNAATIVAEQLDRWFTHLDAGLSGVLVSDLKNAVAAGKESLALDRHFSGYPISSAILLHNVVYERNNQSQAVGKILSRYYYPVRAIRYESDFRSKLGSSLKKLRIVYSDGQRVSLVKTLRRWQASINGHSLWNEMVDRPTRELVFGFIFENFMYINFSIAHTSSIIYSCPYERVRSVFIKHLDEEMKHGELLAKSLELMSAKEQNYKKLRPLSTTIAFTYFLKDLAMTDWRAYSIALSFLQMTISADSDIHLRFYQAAARKNKDVGIMLSSLKKHDEIDAKLGHTDEIHDLINMLEEEGFATEESLKRAALITNLAWSFLDGIRQHYTLVNSVSQRTGWTFKKRAWA